jgi:hypothetical protein
LEVTVPEAEEGEVKAKELEEEEGADGLNGDKWG